MPDVPALGVCVPSAPAIAHTVVIDTLPEGDRELIADFVVECRDYMESAEAALFGRRLGAQECITAGRLARSEARPITDIRGSAKYRAEMVEVLVTRLLEQTAQACPLSAEGCVS